MVANGTRKGVCTPQTLSGPGRCHDRGMSDEARTIAAADRPATVSSLTSDLTALGVRSGSTIIVHSSLSSIGWVAGGSHAVVEALLASVGPEGTIVMPTQSGQLTDPADWQSPPVPKEWIPIIRAETPAYDPLLTPTRGMGAIVECFRHVPEARRSAHPHVSFAAVGPLAEDVLVPHEPSPEFGETSPLGRLYDLGADVLLLGVGHANNTSLHLAEHRAHWPSKRSGESGAPVHIDGERRWVTWADLEHDDSDFDQLGAHLADLGLEQTGPVGNGVGRRCPMPAIVDAAAEWMTANRR